MMSLNSSRAFAVKALAVLAVILSATSASSSFEHRSLHYSNKNNASGGGGHHGLMSPDKQMSFDEKSNDKISTEIISNDNKYFSSGKKEGFNSYDTISNFNDEESNSGQRNRNQKR